jgi:hypothetical protein
VSEKNGGSSRVDEEGNSIFLCDSASAAPVLILVSDRRTDRHAAVESPDVES